MKICHSDNAQRKIASKTKLFYRLLKSGKQRQVSSEEKEQKNAFRHIPLNQIFSDKFSNDIIVNCSGLVKIDDLSSCKDLDSGDFIIF
jgi:hypothetical protein